MDNLKKVCVGHIVAVIPTDKIKEYKLDSTLILDSSTKKDKQERINSYLTSGDYLEVIQVGDQCSFVEIGDKIIVADRRPIQQVTVGSNIVLVIRELDILATV